MRSVIFDMDGVIVDSQLHWMKIQSGFLSGIVSSWGEEDQQRIIGMSISDVHQLLVNDYGSKITKQEMIDYYSGLARKIYLEESNIFEGCAELIKVLHKAGVKLAVASASPSPWIKMTVERFNLEDYFISLVSSDHVLGKGKPAPDIYLKAAENIDSSPSDCLAFEDSKKGVASAKAAGLKCVGFLNGYNKEEDLAEADLTIIGFGSSQRQKIQDIVKPL